LHPAFSLPHGTSNKLFLALGFGLGLREHRHEVILASRLPVEWFEIVAENYLVPGGKPLEYLGE